MGLVAIIFVASLLLGFPMAFVLGYGGLAHLIAMNQESFFFLYKIAVQKLRGFFLGQPESG